MTHYENQTRCFYKLYACSEVSHRAPDWGPKKKNKPICGALGELGRDDIVQAGLYIRVGRMDRHWNSMEDDGLIHVSQKGGTFLVSSQQSAVSSQQSAVSGQLLTGFLQVNTVRPVPCLWWAASLGGAPC